MDHDSTTPDVYDFHSGQQLGRASALLLHYWELSGGPLVAAFRDAGGLWQYLKPRDAAKARRDGVDVHAVVLRPERV